MYHKFLGKLAVVFLVFGLASVANGQATRSPFTAIGIGDVVDLSLAHNQGTGGLGISNGNYWNLNNMNPALLPYNSLTVFSAGFIGENKTLTNGVSSEKFGGGNLNYLATAFPVKTGKWTTSVGLMPYSNVSYNHSYTTRVENLSGTIDSVDVTINETGSGGYNQVYWSNGYAINKSFFVGLKATYLFSSVEKKFSNKILNVGGAYVPVVNDRISVSDFLFSGGLAFNTDSIFNSKVKFKAGITYDLGSDVKAKRFQSMDRTITNGIPLDVDTLVNNQKGTITIPQAIGVGISVNRGLKWMVGVDVKFQKWSDYKDFNGINNEFDDSYKIILGGEYTPDPGSVTSYFKRITFKLGGSYENTPYLVNNNNTINQVKDVGINFGWSLPAGRYSSLDMAFKFGKRGTVEKTLIEENYYKIYLGITFNDQWFIKRKYD